MTNSRANLDNQSTNRTYLILTVVLILLSLLGLYLYSLIPRPVSDDDVFIDRSLSSNEFPTSSVSNPTRSVDPTDVPGTKGGVGEPLSGLLTTDSFSVVYSPERKLYEDREGSGTRYTLYSTQGNIAIHVGPRWSWTHPGRTFSSDFKVANQPTFVYSTSTQKLVDFESGSQKFTVQCVHGGRSAVKDECDQLLSDFKLL